MIPSAEGAPSRRPSLRAMLAGAATVTLAVGFVAAYWSRESTAFPSDVRMRMSYGQRANMMYSPAMSQSGSAMMQRERLMQMPPMGLDASMKLAPGMVHSPVQPFAGGMFARNDYPSNNGCANGYGACTGPINTSPQTVIRQCADGKSPSGCRCFGNGATLVSSEMKGGRCYCKYTSDDTDHAGWAMYLFCHL